MAERPKTVKTTVEIPEDLWRKAKVRAVDERTDLRSVVIAALDAYLKVRPLRREVK
jgi:N-methylhydantoinase A/oxoprolinase/acetone carboxylase beta subunit